MNIITKSLEKRIINQISEIVPADIFLTAIKNSEYPLDYLIKDYIKIEATTHVANLKTLYDISSSKEQTLKEFITNSTNTITEIFNITNPSYKVNSIIENNCKRIIDIIFKMNIYDLKANYIWEYTGHRMNFYIKTAAYRNRNFKKYYSFENDNVDLYISLYKLFLETDKEICELKVKSLGPITIDDERYKFDEFNRINIKSLKDIYDLLSQNQYTKYFKYNNITKSLTFFHDISGMHLEYDKSWDVQDALDEIIRMGF